MNATILDLRRNMKDVIAALDRNERVSLTYRGRQKAMIVPCGGVVGGLSAGRHPAFGIWADRADMEDVGAFVRNLRKGRF